MTIEITRLDTPLRSGIAGGKQVHIKASDGTYYVASSIPAAFDTGQPETLVFPANAEGEIESYGEVAGGKFVSIDEAIDELRAVLNGEKTRDLWDSPGLEDGPLGLMMNVMNPRIPAGYYADEDDDDDW